MKRAVAIFVLSVPVAQVSLVAAFVSFQTLPPLPPIQNPRQRHATTTMMKPPPSMANNRRRLLLATSGLGGIFFGGGRNRNEANAAAGYKSKGATNEVIRVVDGIRHKRLGGSDIVVSELGLGTQRWVSADFNAPSRDDCFTFMDQAILKSGVNLIDTAEQYPIPSGEAGVAEGDSERLIGDWIKDRNVARDKVVIATKITGGRNVTPQNIKKDCEGSLKRLQTDYIDVYQVSHVSLGVMNLAQCTA